MHSPVSSELFPELADIAHFDGALIPELAMLTRRLLLAYSL